jgi:acyl-CoA hydrolase
LVEGKGLTPAESYVSVTRIMLPIDANPMGNVFGGTILGLIEETAWLAAIRHARCNLVTASIDRMDFLAPAYIGDILHFKASVNYVHKTSMEVGVRVEAEKPSTGEVRHTGTCFLTYVALGKDGKPMPIPTLLLKTEEDKRRWDEAEQRQKARLREIGKAED